MFGIGGGLIIVPALLLAVKAGPHQAIGTSLAAQVPPVGLLSAVEYWRAGHINVRWAALIAAGLFIGQYFGARIMISLPPQAVKRAYAVFLLVISLRMLLSGK